MGAEYDPFPPFPSAESIPSSPRSIVRVVNYCYNLGLDAPNEAFAHLAAFFSGQGGQALEHKPPQTSTNLSQLPTHCKGISNFVVESSFQSWSVVSVLLWYVFRSLVRCQRFAMVPY